MELGLNIEVRYGFHVNCCVCAWMNFVPKQQHKCLVDSRAPLELGGVATWYCTSSEGQLRMHTLFFTVTISKLALRPEI